MNSFNLTFKNLDELHNLTKVNIEAIVAKNNSNYSQTVDFV